MDEYAAGRTPNLDDLGLDTVGLDPTARTIDVDERLRVRGVAALRVIDASAMPTITSGNTNSPTIMIADKAAAMMIEDRRR